MWTRSNKWIQKWECDRWISLPGTQAKDKTWTPHPITYKDTLFLTRSHSHPNNCITIEPFPAFTNPLKPSQNIQIDTRNVRIQYNKATRQCNNSHTVLGNNRRWLLLFNVSIITRGRLLHFKATQTIQKSHKRENLLFSLTFRAFRNNLFMKAYVVP